MFERHRASDGSRQRLPGLRGGAVPARRRGHRLRREWRRPRARKRDARLADPETTSAALSTARLLAAALLGCALALACEAQVAKPDEPKLPPRSSAVPGLARSASADPVGDAPAQAGPPPSRCNEQAPQPFLVEAHFDSHYAAGGTRREWRQVLSRAVRYRTVQYGHVPGFGDKAWNPRPPSEQAQVVSFFGVPVPLHRRVAPALACVETAIRARCADFPYQPRVLSGLRKRNTYLNEEISNHVYGIALDVDPVRNPCCGCVGEWGASELCRNDKTKFQRMEMPLCWVTEFERFGFYWLGHAKIEDTMHFEFLADPDKILKDAPPSR